MTATERNMIPWCDLHPEHPSAGRSASAASLRLGVFLRIHGSAVVYRLLDIYEQGKGGNRLSVVAYRDGKSFGAFRNVNSAKIAAVYETEAEARAAK